MGDSKLNYIVVRPTFARNVEGIKGGGTAVAIGAISVSVDAETRRALRVPPARQLRAQSHAVGSCASQIVVVGAACRDWKMVPRCDISDGEVVKCAGGRMRCL